MLDRLARTGEGLWWIGGFDEGEERGRQFHEPDGGVGWCIVLWWVSMIGRGNVLSLMSLVEWNISWFLCSATLSAWEWREFHGRIQDAFSCGGDHQIQQHEMLNLPKGQSRRLYIQHHFRSSLFHQD